jgi:uncharacterized protein YxjI
MGLLRQRDDVPGGRHFEMQEKLVSIGDDSWIEDDQGDRVYEVDGKALRRRDSCVLKDRDGNEVATIQEKKLRARHDEGRARQPDTVQSPQGADGDPRPLRYRHQEGGDDLSGRCNIVDHHYEVKRDGDVIATVSKSSSLSLDTPRKAST